MSRRYRFPKTKKCTKTGKTMFLGEKQASYAMMRTWAHDSKMNIYDYHTYLCPSCSHWHFGNKILYEQSLERQTVEINSRTA